MGAQNAFDEYLTNFRWGQRFQIVLQAEGQNCRPAIRACALSQKIDPLVKTEERWVHLLVVQFVPQSKIFFGFVPQRMQHSTECKQARTDLIFVNWLDPLSNLTTRELGGAHNRKSADPGSIIPTKRPNTICPSTLNSRPSDQSTTAIKFERIGTKLRACFALCRSSKHEHVSEQNFVTTQSWLRLECAATGRSSPQTRTNSWSLQESAALSRSSQCGTAVSWAYRQPATDHNSGHFSEPPREEGRPDACCQSA